MCRVTDVTTLEQATRSQPLSMHSVDLIRWVAWSQFFQGASRLGFVEEQNLKVDRGCYSLPTSNFQCIYRR
jgi:hypothetical protein